MSFFNEGIFFHFAFIKVLMFLMVCRTGHSGLKVEKYCKINAYLKDYNQHDVLGIRSAGSLVLQEFFKKY